MSKGRFTLAEIASAVAAVVILVGVAVSFVRTARDAKNSFGVARDREMIGIALYHSVDPEFDMFGDCEDPFSFETFGFDQKWEEDWDR